MATATPAKQESGTTTNEIPPLWPNNRKVKFIRVAGEFGSGKTMFPLLIDPYCKALMIDTENSGADYESDENLLFDRIDANALLAEKFPNGNYKPIHVYEIINKVIEQIKPGVYRVGFIDTGTEYEDGLVQYVQQNPTLFGFTASQFQKSGALMWGAVKSHYKQRLSYFNTKFETFVVCMHMRDKWSGSAPTGQRESKGKETLEELASFSLIMDRSVNPKTGRPFQEEPSAIVNKTRFMWSERDPQTNSVIPHPILPPRLPKATPDAIRHYISHPADYSNLKKEETIQFHKMSPEDRLRLEAKIAEDQRAAREAEMESERAKAVRAKIESGTSGPAPTITNANPTAAAGTTPTNDTQTKKGDGSKSEPVTSPVKGSGSAEVVVENSASGSIDSNSTSTTTPDVPGNQSAPVVSDQPQSSTPNVATKSQLTEIIGYMKKFEWEPVKIKALVKGNFGKESAKELTQAEADHFIGALSRRWEKEQAERAKIESETAELTANATPHDPAEQAAEDRSALDQWAAGDPNGKK